jgi:hypothetical protein
MASCFNFHSHVGAGEALVENILLNNAVLTSPISDPAAGQPCFIRKDNPFISSYSSAAPDRL